MVFHNCIPLMVLRFCVFTEDLVGCDDITELDRLGNAIESESRRGNLDPWESV